MLAAPPPVVSVVIATYNRSQVLRHAIRSVQASSFADWELLVIGDACTDDTLECVASFADPRIRFVNLSPRCGDQSGPNNHGITLARGRYVAFLQHDDIYLPDHLATCVEELNRSGADLVWTPAAVASPNPDVSPGARPCQFRIAGVPEQSGYSPFAFYCTSTWVFRRELADRVGPWPRADEIYMVQSQDWLFRAWRSGAALRFVPRVGAIVIPAGYRPGSYQQRHSPDHEWFSRWSAEEPRYRELIFEELAVSASKEHLTLAYHEPWGAIRRVVMRPVHYLLSALGLHPRWLMYAVGGKWRRGATVRTHRRSTGAE